MKESWNITTRLVFLINSVFTSWRWRHQFKIPTDHRLFCFQSWWVTSGTLYRERCNIKVQGQGVERFSTACLSVEYSADQHSGAVGQGRLTATNNSQIVIPILPAWRSVLTYLPSWFTARTFLAIWSRETLKTRTPKTPVTKQNAFKEHTIWYFLFYWPYN